MTQLWVFLPLIVLVASAVLAGVAPVVGERCRPELAGPVLSVAAFVCAGCLLASLAMFTLAALGHSETLAGVVWSDAVLDRADMLPVWNGIPAAILLVCLAVPAVRMAAGALGSMARVQRSARHSDIVLVDDRSTPAYAVGGFTRGQVVLCRRTLDELEPAERMAVLAHERAHLRGRHHWQRALATTAAAANPVLRRIPRMVALANELAADRAAVAAVGSRSVVQRAIARLGLDAAAPGPAFGDLAVATRIRALSEDRGYRWWPAAAVVAVLAVVLTGSGIALDNVEDLFEISWISV